MAVMPTRTDLIEILIILILSTIIYLGDDAIRVVMGAIR
jgi:hypothetical protein